MICQSSKNFHFELLKEVMKNSKINQENGGGSLIQIKPSTKGLEFEPEAKRSKLANAKKISSSLDSESAIWYRVNWRLSKEQFLFWYIWLKDHLEEMKEFV